MNGTIARLAHWLLLRFGVSQQNDSLVGDIEEEYRSGRSSVWLLRQVAVAIARSNIRVICSNKFLTLRAIATGWAVGLLYGYFYQTFLFPFTYPRIGFHIFVLYSLRMVLWTIFPWIAGWTVARLHRDQQAAMVLAYGAFVLLMNMNALRLYFQLSFPVFGLALRDATSLLFALAGGLHNEPSMKPRPVGPL